ncbi:MAG: sulfur carrier protein ThiS [Gammaproteobacteria bacterium]|nr:sulfur carrier protein ThiS [Gammaproteobacteria bacterium]
MQVFVNGEPVTIKPGRLSDVLASLGYECEKVAVAVNETFVPRRTWNLRELKKDDRVDVLAAIQGG